MAVAAYKPLDIALDLDVDVEVDIMVAFVKVGHTISKIPLWQAFLRDYSIIVMHLFLFSDTGVSKLYKPTTFSLKILSCFVSNEITRQSIWKKSELWQLQVFAGHVPVTFFSNTKIIFSYINILNFALFLCMLIIKTLDRLCINVVKMTK